MDKELEILFTNILDEIQYTYGFEETYETVRKLIQDYILKNS